jgi:hypothetical protein
MPRKYLAFDLETAKDVPGEDFNWTSYRPLGICCAAALASDRDEPIIWYGKTATGQPAAKMSKSEAREVVAALTDWVARGYSLLTWNGVGFDLDVLAEESGDPAACRELAVHHVDMMFHVFCDRGFPVALDKAAEGLRIQGKLPGMSGRLAPQLWAQGQHQQVIDYVCQDVRVAMQVAQSSERSKKFRWMTRRGTPSFMDLPRGWLPVREAMDLPSPDTSWMSNPIPRSRFTRWLALQDA